MTRFAKPLRDRAELQPLRRSGRLRAKDESAAKEETAKSTISSHEDDLKSVITQDSSHSRVRVEDEYPTPKRERRLAKKPKVSPFFAEQKGVLSKATAPRSRTGISCIPFPPLSTPEFGLAQERLCHEPFHMLLACIFLNKTRGAVAMPVFYDMIAEYPSAYSLAGAQQEDIVKFFQHLGLQNQRARKVKALAQMWCAQPPERSRRYRCLHYPRKGDGLDVAKDECLDDEDQRVAWEVAHLPGVGAYAYDSWRIFCRDALRGFDDQNLPEMEKEWTRVMPLDKELRAYLRWRWLRNGWVWSPLTGKRRLADSREMKDAAKGGVIVERDDGDEILSKPQIDHASSPCHAQK